MQDATPQDGEHGQALSVQVWRSETGAFQSFTVPHQPSQTVLDVVTWIQRNQDPTLTYRFACRVGMCGSCAMTVNGAPRWTCRTHVGRVAADGNLRIGPLRNMAVIRDLAVDMADFFDKWVRAGAVFEPSETREDPMAAIQPDQPARRTADDAIECINCGICYAACDQVAADGDYLGPAALNRAWTLVNDTRDGGQSERLSAVTGPGGCQGCHSMANCARFCPNELSPTASIAGLKRAGIRAAFRRRK